MTLPDGWLSAVEASTLRDLARDQRVLELGAYEGRSTVLMAQVATLVVSVDRHTGITDDGPDTLPAFLGNVRHLPNVAVIVADITQMLPHLYGFDMVYIDSAHDTDSAQRDATLAAAAGATIIAVHDWDLDSVQEGVSKVLWRQQPEAISGTLAVFLL